YRSPDGQGHLIAAKGAPEAIADLCHLDQPYLELVLNEARRMASEGLRVLGVAKAFFRGADLPAGQHDFHFAWLGLIGLADPVRASVKESIGECHRAGIRVVMITGDHPETAASVAREIGLAPDELATGAQLDTLDESDLRAHIGAIDVFA